MVDHDGGTIVNVASVNAFFHPDGLVVDYGAAKAALLNMSKSLSQELGPEGDPSQLRLARSGRDRSLARRPRRRGDDRRGERDDPAAGEGDRDGRHAKRPLHDTRGSRDAGRASGFPRTANVTGSNYVIDGGLIKTM